ncbi:MAG: arsenate reductase ArsC [Planctomycetota bacterium]
MRKQNLLVLCTGNSARSQMAEGFFRKYGADRFTAYSAGTEPKGMNPLSVEAMKEVGIDLSQARSKHLKEYLGILPIAVVVIVCHDADQKCPAIWPGARLRLFWPFEDPAAAQGSHEEKLARFRVVRDQIEARIKEWLDSDEGWSLHPKASRKRAQV